MPACIAFLIGIRDQAAFSGYARAAVQDMEYGPVVPVTCHCAPDGHRDLGGPVVPNLTYLHEADRGGHFAAWEEPELFAIEIRAAFRPLR